MSAYSLLIAQLLVVVYCRRRLLVRAAPRPAGSCRAGPPRVEAVEGFLEGFARVAANEGAYLETALDLRSRVRRPADRCLRGSEGRPLALVAVQKHPRAVRGWGRCLARWWCLAAEC